MCGFDPVTIIGGLVSLAGTAISASGQMEQGRAEARAAEYTQKQNNILAEDALRRGAQEKEGQRRKTAALAARQQAVLAGSNVDIGSGSPLNVLADTAMLGELDAEIIDDNAGREAASYRANADIAGMRAKSAKRAATIGAFGTVLSGVGSLADKWYKPRKT